MAAWTALLPGEFWEWAAPSRQREGESLEHHARKGGVVGAACCLAALIVVGYWNVADLTRARLPAPAHRWVAATAHAAGLTQSWALFWQAPKLDCWFVYHARLANGRSVDLLTGRPALAYERPRLASRQFPNHRWRKLHWRLPSVFGRPYRQGLAEYYCRQWNQSHDADEQVAHLDFFCYRQPIEQGRHVDAFTRLTLAQVTLGEQGGAFADAVRDLGP
jgi:hypothetical protein